MVSHSLFTGFVGAKQGRDATGDDCGMTDFDVIVLGAGTAGVHVAGEMACLGRSVALVEPGPLGGSCPYFACIPSKSLLNSARRGETWDHAVTRREEMSGHRDDTPIYARLASEGVTIVRGYGRVSQPGIVEVDGVPYGYTDLVVTTGSESALPPVEGLHGVPQWTTDEALGCPDLPRRLIVLGGGPVGCELAQVYAAFGSQVTVLESMTRLVGTEAAFVGDILADALRKVGASVRLGVHAERAERTHDGLRLHLSDGATVESDRVLITTGRRPRVSGLGLEGLEVEVTSEAGLSVDSTCQAGDHVWAAGDVTGFMESTHTASYQAQVLVSNLLGKRRDVDFRAIPRVVFTTPSAYTVGTSPAHAEAAGVDMISAGLDLVETARAAVEDDDRGRVELYADRGMGVLTGAAGVGRNAEHWMSELTLAIRAEVPLNVLTDVVHAFPT